MEFKSYEGYIRKVGKDKRVCDLLIEERKMMKLLNFI